MSSSERSATSYPSGRQYTCTSQDEVWVFPRRSIQGTGLSATQATGLARQEMCCAGSTTAWIAPAAATFVGASTYRAGSLYQRTTWRASLTPAPCYDGQPAKQPGDNSKTKSRKDRTLPSASFMNIWWPTSSACV